VVGGKEASLKDGCFEAMFAFVRNYLQGFLCFRRFEKNQMFGVGLFFGTFSE